MVVISPSGLCAAEAIPIRSPSMSLKSFAFLPSRYFALGLPTGKIAYRSRSPKTTFSVVEHLECFGFICFYGSNRLHQHSLGLGCFPIGQPRGPLSRLHDYAPRGMPSARFWTLQRFR